MKIKNIDTLIEKFLSDTISREELASLSEWASESRENRAALSSRMKEWAKDNGSFDADKAFGRFKTRVAMEKRPARSNRRVWLWTAAAAAALAVFGLVSYQAYQVRTYRNLLANEEVTVKAPAGSKSYAELPDGSKVWLNAGSSLTYSYDVSKKERTVDLSGEGFFEVYHDEKTPFTVSSSSLNVRVLGTKFNFRDYPEDLLAEVTLTQGKIALSNQAGEELIMSPDESVTFDKETGTMTRGRSGYQVNEWVSGNLVFDEAPLLEIVRRLERAYSVKINISSPELFGLRFYGAFNSSRQDISEVLQSLSATGKFRYSKERNVITLY